MSCPFYKWNGDYWCCVTNSAVPTDDYYKYCRNYDYDDCPKYKYRKDSSSSSGCFLTTACVEAKRLPDNCVELMTLRGFRDNWLKKQPGGEEEVQEYYLNAPIIVEKINKEADSDSIWTGLYDELVLPCVHMIQIGDMEEAHKKYRNTMEDLLRRYS